MHQPLVSQPDVSLEEQPGVGTEKPNASVCLLIVIAREIRRRPIQIVFGEFVAPTQCPITTAAVPPKTQRGFNMRPAALQKRDGSLTRIEAAPLGIKIRPLRRHCPSKSLSAWVRPVVQQQSRAGLVIQRIKLI